MYMVRNNVIEVNNLIKRFGHVTAIDGISFSVSDGEIVGLLGPNGAGKTTTIDMLIGILKPTAGKISIFGKPFEQNRGEILGEMNFSAAYINLPWKMKVWENLYTFGRLYNIADYKSKTNELLKEFMLEDLRDKFMRDLSSGQQARVYLCKAFINDPKLLLLDEPTAFMDPDVADTLRKLIVKKAQENKLTIGQPILHMNLSNPLGQTYRCLRTIANILFPFIVSSLWQFSKRNLQESVCLY